MRLKDIQQLTQALGGDVMERDPQTIVEALQRMGMEPGRFYQELEMSYRFAETHRDVSFSNTSVSLHSHTFYEILYCCNSCGAEYLVGSERYRLRKGDIVFVPPGISHRPLLPEDMHQPYQRYVLWISTEFMNTLMQQFPDERLYQTTGTRLLRTEGTGWEHLGKAFRRGVEESEKQKPGWELAVTANSMFLLVQLCRADQEKGPAQLKAEKPELLDRVMAYVQAHLAEKITLADVARHFWVSQSTVSQLFRNKMGVSFYKYVTQLRLITAKGMIMEGLSLEAVGNQTGFADYSTFYRAFKQEYGISPSQYRKMQETTDTE